MKNSIAIGGLMRAGVLSLALGSALAATSAPAFAQYGGGGYGGGGYGGGGGGGGGYGPPPDDYDRPRRGPPRDDYDRPRGGGGGGGPQARGSFVQSCQNIQQEGAYLSASCRVRGGGYRESRIDTRSCRSIGNNNGRLVCE